MEYGDIDYDKICEDYWREMKLLSEIMKNINKRNRMECKLTELFSEISKYNKGEEVLRTLQNKSSYKSPPDDEEIQKDKSLYKPNELLEVEHIFECNETNIRKALNLIHKAGYDERWKTSFQYEKDFLDLASIPIYLPGIFPDIISAEFLLHVLHKNRIVFAPRESDIPNEDVYTVYQRKAHRARNKAEQIEADLNIEFANKHRGKQDNPNLWELVNIYSYIDIFNRLDNHERTKTFDGTFSIKRILNQPKEDLFHVLQMQKMSDNLNKLVIFKTIIFQHLSDDDRIKIYCHELIYKAGVLFFKDYLTRILWFPLLALKFMSAMSEKYKNRYDLIWAYFDELRKCYKTQSNIMQKPNLVDDKNFWIDILWNILAKRHVAYDKSIAEAGMLASPWMNLDENQQSVYQSLVNQAEIGVSTRQKFYNKYKEAINVLFWDRAEFDRSWDMGIKALLYLYPARFEFPVDSKYVKKNLRDWFKLKKAKIDKSAKENAEIKKEQSRIKAVEYNMQSIRQNEIFPLMLMIAGAIRADAGAETSGNADAMWRTQFYRDLDNIGNRYSSTLIESLRRIYEAHLQAGIMREREARWRLEMWQDFQDGMQSATSMEAEADQISRFLEILNYMRDVLLEILYRR